MVRVCPGQAGQEIALQVDSIPALQVEGVNCFVQVGDGGPSAGGSEAGPRPFFSAVGLEAGSDHVLEVVPEGWVQTSPGLSSQSPVEVGSTAIYGMTWRQSLPALVLPQFQGNLGTYVAFGEANNKNGSIPGGVAARRRHAGFRPRRQRSIFRLAHRARGIGRVGTCRCGGCHGAFREHLRGVAPMRGDGLGIAVEASNILEIPRPQCSRPFGEDL
jgi:hypothetical protein